MLGQQLEQARVASPFLVRTFEPPIEAAHGEQVVGQADLLRPSVPVERPGTALPSPSVR